MNIIKMSVDDRLNESLAAARDWIHSPSTTTYADFGSTETGDEVHFMLQRTRLMPAALGKPGDKILHGIFLKQIMVPTDCRRKGCATRVLRHLLECVAEASLSYLYIESVLSDEMRAVMNKLKDTFTPVALSPNCFVAFPDYAHYYEPPQVTYTPTTEEWNKFSSAPEPPVGALTPQ